MCDGYDSRVFRRFREERRRKRWLTVLHEVREDDEKDRAVIAHLLARGLLEAEEAAVLRHAARRDTVTRAGMDAYGDAARFPHLLASIAGVGAVIASTLLVGGSSNAFALLAYGTAAVAAVITASWTFDTFLLPRLVGPPVALPPRLPGEKPQALLAGADRYLAGLRIVATGQLVGSSAVLTIVGATPLRGLLAVVLAAPALAYLTWLGLLMVLRTVRNERRWRSMVTRDRFLPMPLAVALDLTWCLTRAAAARPTPHGVPLWLLVWFRGYALYSRNVLALLHWGTGASHRRARRHEFMRTENSVRALMDRYADRFEQIVTPDQHQEVLLEIRDHLRSALTGDLSFLSDEDAPVWWQRILPRAVTAVILAAAAVALPYLPGVTASASALAGIQVGLAVTAVLTLVGTPADAQKSVAEAVKSASTTK